MRFDVAERFSPGGTAYKSSCYTFAHGTQRQQDLLIIGTDNGRLFYYGIPHSQLPHNIRPVELTRAAGTNHNAEVSCLLFCTHKKYVSAQCVGILFSGSLDRSIKVWSIASSINTSTPNTLVQTLFGHTSAVTDIVDGKDGCVLSASEDGTLRMWSPQRGRNMMLNPFFDCTCTLSFGRDVWLSSLAMSGLGPWVCYAADTNGNINILRKGSDDNEIEKQMSQFMNQVTKHSKWEKVHNLGISHVQLVKEENILVSLSYDGTCKVLDPSNGQVLYVITNPRRCIYTGVAWVKGITSFYLVDELGLLEVYNLYHERVVETVALTSHSAKRVAAVHKCHALQALAYITQSSIFGGYFFTLLSTQSESNKKSATKGGARRLSVGVAGEVVLWNLNSDVSCLEFVGHEGAVGGVCVPAVASGNADVGAAAAVTRSEQNGSSGATGRASSLHISKEERLFFTAGLDDGTIRCWDEYDCSESYQFKSSRDASEITVMFAVWQMNRLITGHENGTVCVWNADTGTKVSSRVLHNTVSSLITAVSSHSKLLLGADYSGRIAVWNLTLHYLNPTQLTTVGGNIDGHHNKDDPGILSLAFHERTKTTLSGGNDCTIRFWRLNSDAAAGTIAIHKEAVCLLRCSDSFLLSGDELGNINLSLILTERLSYGSGSKSGSEFVTGVSVLCCWAGGLGRINDTRAFGDLLEVPATATATASLVGGSAAAAGTGTQLGPRALVAQAGAGVTGCSRIWEVSLQPRKTAAPANLATRVNLTNNEAGDGTESEGRAAAAAAAAGGADVDGSMCNGARRRRSRRSRVNSSKGSGTSDANDDDEDGEDDGDNGDEYAAVADGEVGGDDNGEGLISNSRNPEYRIQTVGDLTIRIFERTNPTVYISVSNLHTARHEKYDITCCSMCCQDTSSLPAMRSKCLLYLGTSNGTALRYSFDAQSH